MSKLLLVDIEYINQHQAQANSTNGIMKSITKNRERSTNCVKQETIIF